MSEAAKVERLTGVERAELDRLRTALDASGDVVYEWIIATDKLHWSANAKQAFGLSEAVDIATRAGYVAHINSEDLPGLTRAHSERLKHGGAFQAEYRVRGSDGAFRWVQDRGVVCFTAGGRAERIVGAIRVITSHKQREAHLEWLTSYDELTGHYNRTRLREALSHALAYASRYNAPGAYLVVALNDLAIMSDAYGHDVVDAAVVAAGRALDACLRESDVVGRVAPDQFGVIINGCPEHDVHAAADKILAGVRATSVRTPAGAVHLSASIGGVTFPGSVRTAPDAMIKADVALDHARHAGHNLFVAYNLTEAQRHHRRRHMAVAKQIQTALQRDRLELAYQPVVRTASHEVSFYECLLRMRGAKGEQIAAGDFLPVAEEIGLVRLIDRRVFDMAVDELCAHAGARLAINISGLTTTDAAWLRGLMAAVKRRPDVAPRLTIEITETAALHDMEETIRFVKAVRDVGCRVALDDFGAGYTSFRHLKALAVDIVKIDGSFVTNLGDQPHDLLFIKTLQDLAQGFGLETVAECVETAEVAELLAREGVDYLQGYHFGQPTYERAWARQGMGISRITRPVHAVGGGRRASF